MHGENIQGGAESVKTTPSGGALYRVEAHVGWSIDEGFLTTTATVSGGGSVSMSLDGGITYAIAPEKITLDSFTFIPPAVFGMIFTPPSPIKAKVGTGSVSASSSCENVVFARFSGTDLSAWVSAMGINVSATKAIP